MSVLKQLANELLEVFASKGIEIQCAEDEDGEKYLIAVLKEDDSSMELDREIMLLLTSAVVDVARERLLKPLH